MRPYTDLFRKGYVEVDDGNHTTHIGVSSEVKIVEALNALIKFLEDEQHPELYCYMAARYYYEYFTLVARDKGFVGTLMPKPFEHLPGSGLHVHISMYDENKDNLFRDITDHKGLDLSDKAYHFIGGLLKHGQSLVAVGAPIFNSYKRMLPGSWAPPHVCYGAGNRSVLIRIPEKKRERRFEFHRGST